MITFFYLLFLTFIFTCFSLPIIILFMILLSGSVFMSVWFYSGLSWFSVILCLLFMGGILVVFMVVSSLFPNLKSDYYSHSKNIFYLMSFGSILGIFSFFLPFNSLDIKYICSLGGMFYSLLFIILVYFFSFLFMISKDKTSLRSFF